MKSRTALAALPLALALLNQAARIPFAPPAQPQVVNQPVANQPGPRPGAAVKPFSISLDNLQSWAKTVIVTLPDVKVEGNSAVHSLLDDCEIHFGAHSSAFQGEPNGLVLEPMNACSEDPPPAFPSWSAFAKSIKNTTIIASGVPRLWPEHLDGGTASNPDHAVEMHPLTTILAGGTTFEFGANVFAGPYHGKENNQGIVKRVNVWLTASGGTVNVSFQGGQIGNFTTLDLLIDRASITSDGAGSFRMDAEVVVDDSTKIPVRIVTVKGSPINDAMPKIKKRSGPTENMIGALVLYSLSPEAMLAAASKSNGAVVAVDRPIQLILYGMPDSE